MSKPSLVAVAPKLIKLIPLLSSDKPGEVVATADAIRRTLQSVGADFHDLARALVVLPAPREMRRVREPESWLDLIDACLDFELEFESAGLTARDIDFLEDMRSWVRRRKEPSEKQAAWLRGCWDKVTRAMEAQRV